MKKITKNALKTSLFVCLGLIATIAFAAIPFNPPGAPGIPIVTEIHRTGCTVEYKAPRYDGGSPITGYHIDYRYEESQRWLPLNRVPHKGLVFKVSSVTEGKRILFRVSAENIAGRGPSSIACDPITIRDPFRP